MGSKVVGYVDAIKAWWPPESIAAGMGVPGYGTSHSFNVINLSFWTAQGGPVDTALLWANALTYVSSQNPWGSTTSEIQKAWAKKYHDAGIKIMVSAFGATEMPTSLGCDPVKTATDLAQFVITNNLDGVDLDWEDTNAFDSGVGEQWLITCTQTLRQMLPASAGYIISHAPQAPYFTTNPSQYKNGAYLTVHKQVGDLIDFYNVQFYNQGNSAYSTYTTLFEQTDGWAVGTSVKEMIASGVNAQKIVVGKPITASDATNTGYVPIDQLVTILSSGVANLSWRGGVMAWQLSSDGDGSWSNSVAAVFSSQSPPKTVMAIAITTTPTPTAEPNQTIPTQKQAPKQIVCTLIGGACVKRMSVDCDKGGLQFNQVIAHIATVMPNSQSVGRVFWVDDEGDVCVISSQCELEECLRVANWATLPLVFFLSHAQAKESIA